MTLTTERQQHHAGRNRLGAWLSIVLVVIGLELRQRLRTTRWKVTLGALFVFVSIVVFGSLYLTVGVFEATYKIWATNFYMILVSILLFCGIVLAPTLSATSINGDRKDATLAVVQDTTITHWQLALGKLIGNWASSMTLVVLALPYLIWAVIAAPYGIWPGLLGICVVSVLFACYCGVGLGLSAVSARPAGSAVLTQSVVFFLILGLPAIFGLLFPSTAHRHEVTRPHESLVSAAPNDYENAEWKCEDRTENEEFHHTERTWWLLAPNPFLLVADVVADHDYPDTYSPRLGSSDYNTDTPDPSAAQSIAAALSSSRAGPFIADRYCGDRYQLSNDQARAQSYWYRSNEHELSRIGDSWYIGLAITIVIGGIGLIIAARRLRVPIRKLPRGIRIA
ncbi:ABC transporter permease subunit [Gordonia sp. NPDC003585]|uniref:ABC transporter permease n=1 Tax=Gordonia sp. NPDC003585 TaxID=3154275 RepID=UPI0033B41FBD